MPRMRPHHVYTMFAEGVPDALEFGPHCGAVGSFRPPRVADSEGKRRA